MKLETLQERIAKAEQRVEKKQNTIEKKKKSIEKKAKYLLDKYNINADTFNKYEREGYGWTREESNDVYWTMCDIGSLREDIKRLTKEIPEIQKTIEKYKSQLAGEIEKESIFTNEIPAAMRQLEEQLICEWDRWDFARREKLRTVYDTVGHTAFFKGTPEKHFWDKHTYADYEFTNLTDEEIHNSNIKLAKQEVFDLYLRVKNITGEVTDWSDISLEMGNSFPVLTGTVIGKEGRAYIETVLAGGYNIQRLHIRTLVKPI